MTESHTAVQQVGAIAAKADVPELVLSHIADCGPTATVDPAQWTRWAQQGYGGEVIIGNDLQSITLQ